VDPRDTERQARALAASRRILARIRQDLANEDSPGFPTEEDQELLAGDREELLREDLRVFAEWHKSLGTNPEAVLSEMRHRVRQQVEGS
jgi:hypothetical protein